MRIAILGYHEGNAGQVAEWLERETGWTIAAFADEGEAPPEIDVTAENARRVSQRMEYPTRESYKGRPLIVARNWPERLKSEGIEHVLPLISDNSARLDAIDRCHEAGLQLVSAVHPSALVLDLARIEPGCWISAGAIVGYKAELEAGAMVNNGAQVDHHCILGSCVQLDPGVVLAGHVTVRELAHIHTAATVINRIEIGRGAIVGAGAVVIRNVPPDTTVAGVPAQPIQSSSSA